MQPKTSIELGINKAISIDLRLYLDLAQNLSLVFKNNNYAICTHITYHSGMG